jgi:hypothetical protein
MASTDARPVPQKNVAFRFYFAIRKNDGTLITTWAGQDSEVSKDGGAFADCTNEATEIGTSGVGYLDLTSTEMNADAVTLKVTVTNSSALPLVVTFFPEEAGDIRVNATQLSGDGTAADNAEAFFDGTGYAGTNNVIPTVTTTGTATTIGTTGINALVNALIDMLGTRVTIQTGSTSSVIILDSGASAVDDFYNGSVLVFTAGNLNGQARKITDYVGSTKTATVTAFTTSPANGDTAVILGRIE